MKRNLLFLALSLTLILALPVGLFAQGYENSAGPSAAVKLDGVMSEGSIEPTWGTSATSSVTYVAHAFAPISSSVTYEFSLLGGNLGVYRTNTNHPWMEAPVNLPNGAQIIAVEFRFCDNSDTHPFFSFLTINPKNGFAEQPELVSSTPEENIGCVNRTFTFDTPPVVDNANNAYSLEVNLGSSGPGTSDIILCQARIYYRLQISPAPATATFTDVPTSHPFFQYIEALAASGITTGYDDDTFRPSQPITRGQMAVFLSKALGLHWPD